MSKKVKNLARYIAATNKKFEAASPEQKRVMIAEDVILRVEQDNIRPKKSYFIDRSELAPISMSFKTFINDNDNACHVCAKGAMFCSIIGRVNKKSMLDMKNLDINTCSTSDPTHGQLMEYFSGEQLDLIETAFEGRTYLDIADCDDRYNAEHFYSRYNNENERLIAICNNIIINNGTFMP